MNRKARLAGLIGAGVLIAGAGFWYLETFMSRDAQIDSMHRGCVAEFVEMTAKLKPGDPATGLLKGLSERFGRLLDGVSGNMSDTVCGALRDACREDFDGGICTAARERYL